MTPDLARRARRALLASLNPEARRCPECHCSDCRRDHPHTCALTRLLDDLARAARKGRSRR